MCIFSYDFYLSKYHQQRKFYNIARIDDINCSKVEGITTVTTKGHIDQERRNLQSTKMNKTQYFEDTFREKFKQDSQLPCHNYSCCTKEMTYLDQTGRFPY